MDAKRKVKVKEDVSTMGCQFLHPACNHLSRVCIGVLVSVRGWVDWGEYVAVRRSL